jgi:hypothetical protein
LLFSHDADWEKQYLELRKTGKISDGEDKPEETLTPSKTKYSKARKSRYTLPAKREKGYVLRTIRAFVDFIELNGKPEKRVMCRFDWF